MSARLLWFLTNARKIGRGIPAVAVGRTKREARATCEGCPLLARGCYAWSGTPALSFGGQVDAAEKDPERYDMMPVVAARAASARMIRVSTLGDIGGHGPDTRDAIQEAARAEKLAIIGYTHRWRDTATRDTWRGTLMASADTLTDADRALEEGWRAAVVVPADTPRTFTTPKGHKGIVCPEQVNGSVTCNTCRLCDASKPGPIIGFREHGPKGQTPADYRRRSAG